VAETENDEKEILKREIVEAHRLACEDSPEKKATPMCKLVRSDPDLPYDQLMTVDLPFNYREYFEDLNDIELFPDEPDIPDLVYFALNDENLVNSQALEWYACGTVIWQEEPEWKQYGEWELFWRKYLYEPNFRCLNGFASCNYQAPTVAEIRHRFPDNRPLARRVLFITLLYEKVHSYTNALDVSVDPSS
jgi:hypothetical protein